jgi:hypothetical protein
VILDLRAASSASRILRVFNILSVDYSINALEEVSNITHTHLLTLAHLHLYAYKDMLNKHARWDSIELLLFDF